MQPDQVILVKADNISLPRLHAFLHDVYPKHIADFIIAHREWLYQDFRHSAAIMAGEQMIAFSGAIPFRYSCKGIIREGRWWVNLIVHPDLRGMGMQQMIADEFRRASVTWGAFTNARSSAIFRRQGWSQEQGKYRTLLLPLRLQLPAVPSCAADIRRFATQSLLGVVSIPFLVLRLAIRRNHLPTVRASAKLDIPLLANLYHQFNKQMPLLTTCRDEAHLRWRYADCPYHDELTYYMASPTVSSPPETALIARFNPHQRLVRILDVFGNLEAASLVDDLIKAVIRDAAQWGAYRITTIATLPALIAAFRRNFFWIASRRHFNWYDADPAVMRQYAQLPAHWVLGDSDNDSPIPEMKESANA